MRFKAPIKGLVRAAKRGDTRHCSKFASQLAHQLEAQAKDLLIAATFGWDAVGALDNSSGPFSAKELKLIKQQLQVAKHARQAEGAKGSNARRTGTTDGRWPPGQPSGQQQQRNSQQRYPHDYRPPR